MSSMLYCSATYFIGMENSFHVTVQFDKSKLTLWYLQTLLMLAKQLLLSCLDPFVLLLPKNLKLFGFLIFPF